MSMSFETALNIAAEVAAEVPDNSFSRHQFLKALNWQRYWEAVNVLVESRREMPGPLVIFLPGECGVPLGDRRFDRIKNRTEQLCECGNVRLLHGVSVMLPNSCPIFIRRRSRKNSEIGLLRFTVENGMVRIMVRPFDPINLRRMSVPVLKLLELEIPMIGVQPPDAAVLSILNFDPRHNVTEIEVNGQYEIFEPPYDPEDLQQPLKIN